METEKTGSSADRVSPKALAEAQASAKAGRYLKYAIGEIILVVIGILIALQINNWNEQRKQNQQETNYYGNIKEDIELDIFNIEQSIYSLEERSEATRRLLVNLLSIQEDKSVILADYLSTVRSISFIPSKSAILDITSSGKLEILKNKKIKNAVLQYYAYQDYGIITMQGNREKLDVKIFDYNDFTDFGIQEIPMYRESYGTDLQALMQSSEWQKDPNHKLFRHLKDHMNMTIIICQREKQFLMNIKDRANQLIEEIDTTLNSN